MFRGILRTLSRVEPIEKQLQRNLKRSIYSTQKNSYQYLDEWTDPNDVILKSPRSFMHIPNITIEQYVWFDVGKFTKYTAMVDGVTGREMTYGELRDKCRVLAIKLQKKFKSGDTMAVCLPNCIEYPICVMGPIEAGMIVTIVNPLNTATELAKQLVDSETKMLFGVARMSHTLEKAVELSKRNITIVYLKEKPDDAIPAKGVNFQDLVDPHGIDPLKFPEHPRNYQNITLLPYSSGTAYKPKGVELTHRNIVSNSLQLNSLSVCQDTTDSYQDVFPCVLPYFHIYGITLTLISKLALGAKIVTLPNFSTDLFLDCMEKYKGSVLNLVPPQASFLANSDRVNSKNSDSVRNIICGAGPIEVPEVEKLLQKYPNAKLKIGYGMVECSPAICMSAPDSTNYTSVGKLLPNTEAKIVALGDCANSGLGPNQSGEILIRGPQVMERYLNDREATKDIFTQDGFLRTGDIGHYDEKQEFYITDRLKELMKVKGFQVAPAELEDILKSHPKIVDAAVVGRPHKVFGELPTGFIVKKPDETITEKEIQEFVADKVAYYKQLEGGIEFLETIPKNKTGGVMRKVLFDQYCRASAY